MLSLGLSQTREDPWERAGSLKHGAKKTLGLALGGGAARGWSHIGVIRALEDFGLIADVIAGTSAGSVVGAIYAAGELDAFEQWACALGRRQIARYFDFALRGGLFKADKMFDFVRQRVAMQTIERLPRRFAAVATDLRSGEEVWLTRGPLVASLRASVAIPGVVRPVDLDGRFLVDGGVVNPVPVNLCYALGAEVVIAVDPSACIHGVRAERIGRSPSMLEAVSASIEIMQAQIIASRGRQNRATVTIAPRLQHIGRFDFHRAAEAIEEGRRAAVEALKGFHIETTGGLRPVVTQRQ
jgi:NTE family protein